MMSDLLITKSEFAKLVQLSKGRVTQLVVKGMPTTADGLIDVGRAKDWIRANVRQRIPSQVGTRIPAEEPKAPADPDDYTEARYRLTLAQTQKALADAERSEVALASERGSTIPKVTVRKFIRDWNTKTRIGFLNFATRRGPAMAAALGIDEVTLVTVLEANMREHLADMADEPLPMADDAEHGAASGVGRAAPTADHGGRADLRSSSRGA